MKKSSKKNIVNAPSRGNLNTQQKVKLVENYLSKKYQFRYNPISDRTEFKVLGNQEFQPMTERDINSMFRELNHRSVSIQMSLLKSILHSDFIPTSDPFLEYFKSLPPYKPGDPDYIGELMDTVTVDNQAFFRMAFPKWLVNTVACSINPSIVNQNVLVLVGRQGIGKSTWLNRLVPTALEGYLYSGIVNPNNKDTLVNLAENFIINLDELENLNKTELGSLKALITQSAIKLRKAYGVFNENFTRRASFVGSVNEVEFLTDPTGNRRYLVISCTDINFLHNVSMDKVYSQAYHLYKSQTQNPGSFVYFFDKNDVHAIEKNNEMFNRVSIEEELLLKFFRVPVKEDSDEEVIELTPTDVMNFLVKESNIRPDPSVSRRIGLALQKHNFKKVSRNNRKPYKMVAVNSVPAIPKKVDGNVPVEFKVGEGFSIGPVENIVLKNKGKKGS